MHFRGDEIDVSADDPYKNDLFDRKQFVESIIELVKLSSGKSVISIEGRWGSGKTSVAKMLSASLAANNVRSVYYDAYQNDYLETGSLGILASLCYNLPTGEASGLVTSSGLLDATKKVTATLAKVGFGVAIRAITAGSITGDGLSKEISESITEGTKDKLGDLFDETLDDYMKSVESIKAYKESLRKYAIKMKESSSGPLVILVDELDRCRPKFAVKLLESIKVLFDVDDIVFILFINPRQLEIAIRNEYGDGIDSNDYLHKFIDVKIALPACKTRYGDGRISRFIGNFQSKFQIADGNIATSIHGAMSDLGDYFECSLREIERVYINSIIAAHRYGKMFVVNRSYFAVVLSYMKIKDPGLLTRIASGRIDPHEIRSFLLAHPRTKSMDYSVDQSQCYHYIDGFLSLIENKRDKSIPVKDGFENEFMRSRNDDYSGYLSAVAATIENCGTVG